ncbi:MAG: protein-glutamate O-methyltransferase CheR [Gammaproteobacteria bacterium]|nr:protein-glutamate O-methyltransferase CheR [Gammaproteobacteria bacterium]
MKTQQQILRNTSVQGEILPEMDEPQFRQWVDLIEERTGKVFPPTRKSFLITNLVMRMKEIGCASYQEYYEQIKCGINGLREWTILVDRIIVNETRFFRCPSSLDLVKETVESKCPGEDGSINIQAWSVACSTGEEVYTLAIVIDQALASRSEESHFGVTATDICQAALVYGREAFYKEKGINDLDNAHMQQYFEEVEDGRYRVCDRLRQKVCFARMNIEEIGHEPVGNMDIIYCQNLLIYFDRERREEIAGNLVEHLQTGGLLILGSGELTGWKHPLMEKVSCNHTLAYKRCKE